MLQSPLLPLVFGAGYAIVSALRVVWLRRTAGADAYVIDHADPVHRFIAHVFFAVGGGLFLYFGALAIAPAIEASTGTLSWAVNDLTRGLSAGLMLFAIAWTAYAQASMGTSWRIGIPAIAPPLRTNGAFAASRNPIFFGMLSFVLGMCLWSPGVVTVALLVASYITLEVQIRSEEEFLERAHGEAYRAYRARVRRWF